MTSPLFPFETRLHREALSVHRPHHIGVTDPAVTTPESVKAWHLWWEVDSATAPTKYKEWLRNADNSAWLFVNAWYLEQPYTDGQVPVADTDGYFLPGDVDGGGSGGPATVDIEDEGVPEGAADTIDFTGSGVSVTFAAGKATVDIPGGGGSLIQAYVGYNTIGGSQENVTGLRVYMKSITLANDCLLTAIEAHVDFGNGTDNVDSLGAALFTDNSGSPHRALGYNTMPATSLLLDDTSGAGGGTTGRWFSIAMGRWLAAGTYWIAVYSLETVASLRIYYDGSGSDKYYDSAGAWITDAGFYTVNSTTNRYSIRANTIR